MRKLLVCLAVTLLVNDYSVAEELYFPRDFKYHRVRTTEIDRLVVPDVAKRDVVIKTYGEPVDLKVDQWQNGQYFTDGVNRAWYPLRGGMAKDKPEKVTGWFLRSDHGRQYFLTEGGTLYTPDAPPQAPQAPGASIIRALEALQKESIQK